MKKIFFSLLTAGLLYACGGTPSKERTDVLLIVGTGDVSDTAIATRGETRTDAQTIVGTGDVSDTAIFRADHDTIIVGCGDVSDVGIPIDRDIDLPAVQTFDTTLYRVCKQEERLCFIPIKPSGKTEYVPIPPQGLYLWKQGSDWAYALHP